MEKRIVEQKKAHGILFQIIEEPYEFGWHYVLYVNGQPGFHTIDLDRIRSYMNSYC